MLQRAFGHWVKPVMNNIYASVDQAAIYENLNKRGFARVSNLLSEDQCQAFIDGYNNDNNYRSTINMSRYNFGSGQYRYFKYPLQNVLVELRQQSYDFLAPVARKWAEHLKQEVLFPSNHQEYLVNCHNFGQPRPTPLILQYHQGDYNCLHQDLYGDIVFPMQLVIMLSDCEKDFRGGELVLTEQRPRMQSRAHVLQLKRGEAAIISVNHRPVLGTRGYYKATMRHGVSAVESGVRHTLGIILHDAK